jgi:hypothetical protein
MPSRGVAERLEALAIAAERRARRTSRPEEIRAQRLLAEALWCRARFLRAAQRVHPPLSVVAPPAPPDPG